MFTAYLNGMKCVAPELQQEGVAPEFAQNVGNQSRIQARMASASAASLALAFLPRIRTVGPGQVRAIKRDSVRCVMLTSKSR